MSSLDVEQAPKQEDDGRIRTGTLWSCIAHIITVVIGSGVLSLAWSTAQLGWVAGPISLLLFALMTYVSACLLSECYRSPNSVTGVRNCRYGDAVRVTLGEKKAWICSVIQYMLMYFAGVAFTITASISMGAILQSIEYRRNGKSSPSSHGSTMLVMLLFGGLEIILSQIPNFHNLTWLSIMAATMSFGYSIIGFALALAKFISNGTIRGGIRGTPGSTMSEKAWLVSQGLGDVAFAYPYAYILLEIQDTLKSPPAENKTMKKASMISISIITFFYFCCGGFGYAAFGDKTPGNLLTGFQEPFWLVDFANICIILHLLGAYQMCSQPIFALIERWLIKRFPNNEGFINNFYAVKLPGLPTYRLNLLRLCYRMLFVASTTGIAILFPYFNQVLGIIGAVNYWPMSVYFPVEMYFIQKEIKPWTRKWVMLRMFSIGSLFVSIFALVGSVEGVFNSKLS